MAKYVITASCGHEVKIELFGRVKDRQWKIDWYKDSYVCEDCVKARQAKESEKNAAIAKEYGFEALVGTEKQVEWAETIRMGAYKRLHENYENSVASLEDKLYDLGFEYGVIDEPTDFDIEWVERNVKLWGPKLDGAYTALHNIDDFLGSIKSAKYLIDNRDYLDGELWKWIKSHTPEKEAERRMEQEIRDSLTITPENVTKQDKVTLTVSDNTIKAEYTKDADFIAIVKSLGYMWSGYVWQNTFPEVTGSIIDREAEIGHKLLKNGFMVTFSTIAAKEKAVSGDYEDIKPRYILKVDNTHLLISWMGKDDKMYRAGKELKSAKYDGAKHGFIVKASYYQDIEGLIDYMGMAVSEAAKAILQAEKDKVLKADLTKIEAHKSKKASEEAKLDEILQSSREVLADLVEDED